VIDYDQEQMQRLEPIYLDRYGLNEAPFASTLDDRFFYSTTELTQHRNMLVHMTQYSDMLLLVTAEDGMGKTSLLHSYIKAAQDNWHICRISANDMIDEEQLLFKIAEDFRIEALPATSTELQEMLYDKLTRLHQNDILPVVIIDDAHRLPAESLEQLLYMTEIKADDAPMMHFVLFAEPEIETTLESLGANKLYEQNCHSITLSPFTEQETEEYIKNRLAVAGLQGKNPFTPKIIKKIHRQSNGVPAHINELAHVILDDGIEQAEQDLPDDDDEMNMKMKHGIKPIRLAMGMAAVGLVAIALWQQDRINQFFAPANNKTELAQPQTIPTVVPTPQQESPFAATAEQRAAETSTDTQTEITTAVQSGTPAAGPAPAAAIEKPLIARIEPDTISTGTRQQTLTLHGQHFTPQTKVTVLWPGHEKQLAEHQVNIESETQIKFLITPGNTPEQWQVMVNNPQHGQSNTIAFRVKKAALANNTGMQADHGPDWVAAQPKQNLTLQLMGSRQRQALSQFMQQHKLSGVAAIYKTRHGSKDWYVLLYGSYNKRQQAKAMMAQLPDTAKAYKPWIRSFASLKSANTNTNKGAPKPGPVLNTGTPAEENVAAHEAWLWSQDPGHFTVQLLGTQNEKNLEQFIQTNKLRGKVVYFRTRRNEHDWFTLVYGAYADNNAARRALKTLPQPLQQLTPWVRNFSAIHAEIDTDKQP